MKKKLLFVTLYLQTGGVEKSLISLLSSLDYSKYEVDLLLFDHSGVLFNSIPKGVNVLPPLFETFSTPLSSAIPQLVKKRKGKLLIGKVLAPAAAIFSKGVGTGARWSIYRMVLPQTPKKYDVAISYLDFFSNYYVAEKVKADRKIVYNHMDYSSKVGWQNPKLERTAFERSDYIVTVADTSKKALVNAFPEFKEKIKIIHNTVSIESIQSLAKAFKPFEKNVGTNIVTVARLVQEKGVLLALDACKHLVEAGYQIRWFLVGGGPLYNELTSKIQFYNLTDNFILLGEQENPYPFIAEADLYVQPSFTEAHCVAVEEALALAKPIIVTNISSFKEQIKHQETGIIEDLSPEGVASGIKTLINNSELRGKLSKRLRGNNQRNQEELKKFYKLIEH